MMIPVPHAEGAVGRAAAPGRKAGSLRRDGSWDPVPFGCAIPHWPAGRCLASPHGAPHLPAQTPVGTGDSLEPPLYSVVCLVQAMAGALRAVLDRAVIEALADRQQPTFSDPMERRGYGGSRELLQTTGSLRPPMPCAAALGPERLVELVALVGYGCMLSLWANTFEPDPFPHDRALVPAGSPPTTYARTPGGTRLLPWRTRP